LIKEFYCRIIIGTKLKVDKNFMIKHAKPKHLMKKLFVKVSTLFFGDFFLTDEGFLENLSSCRSCKGKFLRRKL
jgi:hypothetical protein